MARSNLACLHRRARRFRGPRFFPRRNLRALPFARCGRPIRRQGIQQATPKRIAGRICGRPRAVVVVGETLDTETPGEIFCPNGKLAVVGSGGEDLGCGGFGGRPRPDPRGRSRASWPRLPAHPPPLRFNRTNRASTNSAASTLAMKQRNHQPNNQRP